MGQLDNYTTVLKFGVSRIFLMFFKEVSYAHHNCIYFVENTIKVILWNIITI